MKSYHPVILSSMLYKSVVLLLNETLSVKIDNKPLSRPPWPPRSPPPRLPRKLPPTPPPREPPLSPRPPPSPPVIDKTCYWTMHQGNQGRVFLPITALISFEFGLHTYAKSVNDVFTNHTLRFVALWFKCAKTITWPHYPFCSWP